MFLSNLNLLIATQCLLISRLTQINPQKRRNMRSFASHTSCLSDRAQSLVRALFKWIGRHIHSHYMRFISAGILLIIVCCVGSGIYYSQICRDDETKCIENRALYLWIPRQSTVWSQYTEIVDTFGTYPTILVLLLTANADESILRTSTLNTALNILDTINDITLDDDEYGKYEYNDLCTRSSPTQSDCDSEGDNFFAVFFQNNESLWNDMDTTLQIINTPDAPNTLYLGGLQYAEGNTRTITSAKSLRLVHSLRGSRNETV